MKSILLSSLIILMLYACGEQANLEGCYSGNVGKDTVFLSIHPDGDFYRGELVYQFFEKDHNKGSVEGELLGDTLLLLEYTFMSEGTESMRQVAFLLKGDKMSEGYGEMEEVEGNMKFKKMNNLSFGEGFVLYETDCQYSFP